MGQLDYFKGLNIAITISAKDGEILYQNDSSIEVNGDARGRDLMKCHNERSQQIIRHLLDDAATNVYTISKKGKKKLISKLHGMRTTSSKSWADSSSSPSSCPTTCHITTVDKTTN